MRTFKPLLSTLMLDLCAIAFSAQSQASMPKKQNSFRTTVRWHGNESTPNTKRSIRTRSNTKLEKRMYKHTSHRPTSTTVLSELVHTQTHAELPPAGNGTHKGYRLHHSRVRSCGGTQLPSALLATQAQACPGFYRR